MSLCVSPGIPTSYPADAMQCCIDCANGCCNEPPLTKLWAHYVAASYAATQAQASPCPCPCPCPPCSVAEFESLHSAKKAGGKGAGPFNWLALLQLILAAAGPLLQELLNILNPPKPTP